MHEMRQSHAQECLCAANQTNTCLVLVLIHYTVHTSKVHDEYDCTHAVETIDPLATLTALTADLWNEKRKQFTRSKESAARTKSR